MEKHITIDPTVMLGKPVIKGTRIPVYLIVNLLKAGYTFARIQKAYPQLKKKDIQAALSFAEQLVRYEDVREPRVTYGKIPPG